MSAKYFTHQPLVIIGATGRLASELAFYSQLLHFSSHLILCGSSYKRLQGLKDELEEASFDPQLVVETTCSMTKAVEQGGFILFAKSVPGGAQTREEMLMLNAPFAKEAGEALAQAKNKVIKVVCVSNPSDLMGLILLVHSGLSPELVMSLSSLDTERLKRTLSRKANCSKDDLQNTYTLGSHDTKMAPMLDLVRVKGKKLSEIGITSEEEEEIIKEVREAGIMILKQRGQTAYQSPAVHCLRLLSADDNTPFTLPTARYHHSKRYPYTFGSFPTIVDSEGCHHLPIKLSESDLKRLDDSFVSIEKMKRQLIHMGFLPNPTSWHNQLQKERELII